MDDNLSWFSNEEFWKEFYHFLFHKKRMRLGIEEIPYLENLLEIKEGDKILDLCCGPGRHSIILANKGYNVTGVDITKPYLNIAEQKAKKENLNIEFIHKDMRDFIRPNHYDAVINLYSSFGYFEDINDDKKTLRNIFKSLKENGVLLIDMIGKEILAKIFNPRDWMEENNIIYLQERKISNNWSWLDNIWTIIKDGKVKKFNISHRIYSAFELKTILNETGFSKVDIYGDIDGSEYNQNAKRLITVAKK